MTYLCVENHLYYNNKPFALAYNLGDLGFIVRYLFADGRLSIPVHFISFTDFCEHHPTLRSRLILGVPFPVNSSGLSDVK